MTIFFPDLRSGDTGVRMKSADAALQVRRWFDKHGGSVVVMLLHCGIRTAADRTDLQQEVFTTAFLTLLRGEAIDAPGAWLNECARKKASNYRRKRSLTAPPAGGEEVSTMVSPEQLAEDREALSIALGCLDKESQDIVLAARVDCLSWEDIASERGITVDQARYLYDLAVVQMATALNREHPRASHTRLIAFPILITQVFDAIRAELDSAPPELDRRVRENLDRFMEAAGEFDPDPESERVSVARPSPTSVHPTPSMKVGPALGILGGGVAIGIVLGYLLHGATHAKPSTDPNRARSTPVVALVESAARIGDVEALAPLLPANGTRTIHGELVAQRSQDAKSASAVAPVNAASTKESLELIDRARSAFRAKNARSALTLLSQHAHRFPGKRDEEERRELLSFVCAIPAGHGAAECGGLVSSSAPQ